MKDRSGSSRLRRALFPVLAVACCMAAPNAKSHAQVHKVGETYLPQSVIIDTDIGGDIDDVYAVALALHSRELNVLGIMTEFENTELEARLTSRFLKEDRARGYPGGGGNAQAGAGEKPSERNTLRRTWARRCDVSQCCGLSSATDPSASG